MREREQKSLSRHQSAVASAKPIGGMIIWALTALAGGAWFVWLGLIR